MNVTGAISRFARDGSGAPAIIDLDHTVVSYERLDRWIDAAACRLVSLGVRAGQVVALDLSGPDETLALVLALALARLGVASADPALPARLLALSLRHRAGLKRPRVRQVAFDRSWLEDGDTTAPPVAASDDPNAVLRVFATGGIAAPSRHAAVTHGMMAQRLAGSGFASGAAAGSLRVMSAMNLGGASGMCCALGVFHAGGTLVITGLSAIIAAVLRHGVTTLATTPYGLQQILRRIPPGLPPLPSLRTLRVTGGPLPPQLAHDAAARLCPRIETAFDRSETGIMACGAYGGADNPLVFGRLMPGIEVEAVDRRHRPLPPDSAGLLRVRGPGVVAGYLGPAAASRTAFRDGWFYPGHRGTVSDGQVLTITGRDREMIDIGGPEVSPRFIETVLLSDPGVKEAAAFAIAGADGLPEIWAAIGADTPVAGDRLDRACARRLGAVAPRFILHLKHLPRSETGQVLIPALAELARRRKPAPH